MPSKTEAKDIGDLLENLGETFAIHYMTAGSKQRQIQVIGGPGFARQILDEFLQDASMLEVALVLPGGQWVRLKKWTAEPAGASGCSRQLPTPLIQEDGSETFRSGIDLSTADLERCE